MPMVKFVARCALFIVILAVVAEVFFRTVVPATMLPANYMSTGGMIFRFDPTWVASGVATHGRLGLHPTTWHINKAGWNSPFDYAPPSAGDKPRIAILGDSYIQAISVNVNQHVDVDLHALADQQVDVYAFGGSGWYLEQYVALSRYVGTHFAPDTYVIFIDWHDIADSLQENGVKTAYAWQIVADGSGFRELRPPVHYVFGKKSRLLRQSAIVRYVRENLGITWGQKNAVVADVNLNPGGAAPTEPATPSPLVRRAARWMVARLVAEHPGRSFVFVVDTDRTRIYAGSSSPDPRPEYEALLEAARPFPNVHFLDLQPVFLQAYEANHRKFEGFDGGHWSAYGDAVVARALYARLLQLGLVPPRVP